MGHSRAKAALSLAAAGLLMGSCASYRSAASAEEYYSLGTAYFDLGKYAEAEKWFGRAAAADKTRRASEYNLGRIAFEQGRYAEAAERFESLLSADPDNIPALKGAAFSRLRAGEGERAVAHYRRIVALVPESLDSRYNFALVLFKLEKYDDARQVLRDMNAQTGDDGEALLLLARVERAAGRVEAVDLYAGLAEKGGDAAILTEYAEAAEAAGFYARAVEAYERLIRAGQGQGLGAGVLRFRLARSGLLGDGESERYVAELKSALAEGFSDQEALRSLAEDARLGEAARRAVAELGSAQGDESASP